MFSEERNQSRKDWISEKMQRIEGVIESREG